MLYHESHFDGKIDSWALGVILYEMLGGTNPFEGESLNKIADSIRDKQVDLEADAFESTSIEAIDVVENLLEKDSRNRTAIKDIVVQSWFLEISMDERIKGLAHK